MGPPVRATGALFLFCRPKSTMDPTKHSFSLLKPIMLEVMSLVTALGCIPSTPVSPAPLEKLVVLLLSSRSLGRNQDPNALLVEGLPRCIDYILLPVLMLLPGSAPLTPGQPPLKVSDRIVEASLRACSALLLAVGLPAFCEEGGKEAERIGDVIQRCLCVLLARGFAGKSVELQQAQTYSTETLCAACDLVTLICGYCGGGVGWMQNCKEMVRNALQKFCGGEEGDCVRESEEVQAPLPGCETSREPDRPELFRYSLPRPFSIDSRFSGALLASLLSYFSSKTLALSLSSIRAVNSLLRCLCSMPRNVDDERFVSPLPSTEISCGLHQVSPFLPGILGALFRAAAPIHTPAPSSHSKVVVGALQIFTLLARRCFSDEVRDSWVSRENGVGKSDVGDGPSATSWWEMALPHVSRLLSSLATQFAAASAVCGGERCAVSVLSAANTLWGTILSDCSNTVSPGTLCAVNDAKSLMEAGEGQPTDLDDVTYTENADDATILSALRSLRLSALLSRLPCVLLCGPISRAGGGGAAALEFLPSLQIQRSMLLPH